MPTLMPIYQSHTQPLICSSEQFIFQENIKLLMILILLPQFDPQKSVFCSWL